MAEWRIRSFVTLGAAPVASSHERQEWRIALRTIRLEPCTTKNKDGREVTMAGNIHTLLTHVSSGKSAEFSVLTRTGWEARKGLQGDMGERLRICWDDPRLALP
jgi:hypothetical protein